MEEAIDVDGGERVQSAVEAGLLEASKRRASEQEASSLSGSKASQPQQESQAGGVSGQPDLQATSNEQLESAIQEMRSQRQDPGESHSEGSNGSDQREANAVTADSPGSRQS